MTCKILEQCLHTQLPHRCVNVTYTRPSRVSWYSRVLLCVACFTWQFLTITPEKCQLPATGIECKKLDNFLVLSSVNSERERERVRQAGRRKVANMSACEHVNAGVRRAAEASGGPVCMAAGVCSPSLHSSVHVCRQLVMSSSRSIVNTP